jgi:protein SCO1
MTPRRHGALPGLVLWACTALSLACGGEREPDWKTLYDRWEHPDPIPDFALVDQHGKRFGLGQLGRQHVLIGFIYTRCPLPQACPLTIQTMRRVHARWRELAAQGQDQDQGQDQARNLTLLGVTLDPDFDTPERLRAYAEARGLDLGDWILATGPRELVHSALPSLFNVLALPGASGDIQHTVKVALLGPGLTLVREWTDDELSAPDIVDQIIGAMVAAPRRPE